MWVVMGLQQEENKQMENYIEFVFWGEDKEEECFFEFKSNQILNIKTDKPDIHGHIVVHVYVDTAKR